MLASLLGSCILLPRTWEEKETSGDGRGPMYQSFDAYRNRYRGACQDLQTHSLLLPEDAALLLKNLETRRKLFPPTESKGK